MRLLQDGYSHYLFVPDSFSLYETGSGRGSIRAILFSVLRTDDALPGSRLNQGMTKADFRKNRDTFGIPCFYEDTHAEMLIAKKAMDARGFKKAIFVSSPYHMRRIKIMADRMFDSSYDIQLVPTRFAKWSGDFPGSWQELKPALAEFPKISWFLFYDLYRQMSLPQ